MKASSATSARATAAPQPTGQSSARPRPSPTSAELALAGPSSAPDPRFHAYRKDLADVALAGEVIASHYAEPVERLIGRPVELRSGPSEDADVIGSLRPDQPFALIEDSVGWAWGYAGEERRVGYVRSEALSALS